MHAPTVVRLHNGLWQSLYRLHQPTLSYSNLRVPNFEVLELLVSYVPSGQNLSFFHVTKSLHISHNLPALRFSNLHHLALGRCLPTLDCCICWTRVGAHIACCIVQLFLPLRCRYRCRRWSPRTLSYSIGTTAGTVKVLVWQ
jgi:hypothetical protein